MIRSQVYLRPHSLDTPVRPRNILFIIDQLCEMGGAERVLLQMIDRLPRDRFLPRLVTFKIDPSLGIFDRFPCPLHLLPLNRTWDAGAVKVAWEINRLIRRESIDIVHTFFETSDIWAGAVARLSGVRVLISSRRDMGILRASKHRLAYRLLNPFFNEVHTVSEQVREYCIRHDRLSPDKVITLYNGVDIDRVAGASAATAVRSLPALERASHLITTVAHVRQIKGLDVLLHTAAHVRRRFPRVAFVVMGDNHQPAHYEDLMRLRHALDLDNHVHFPGPVEDVFGMLKASNVFYLPSRSEGLSNALLESMACGVPCVATRVGGNPELVREEHNGFLVPSEDSEAAAAKIVSLLESPAMARRMGDAGREMVARQFTTEAMMQQLVRSYERLSERSAERH
jgi:glycosyltransferase involved in cell wall biosynthesis